MRLNFIGFLLLQILLWSIVFSDEKNSFGSDQYENIADTWRVVDYGNPLTISNSNEAFYQLILNEDGTFMRKDQKGTTTAGIWSLDPRHNALVLSYSQAKEKYRIVQLPKSEFDHLVLQKEAGNALKSGPEYKLARL
ncbi:MAG TPA: hypothetical protein DDY13_01390 [Cytophagales bacterium]|jgi:hypothetical protein|nr:hypothetical protein [Cytophagales bacterium]